MGVTGETSGPGPQTQQPSTKNDARGTNEEKAEVSWEDDVHCSDVWGGLLFLLRNNAAFQDARMRRFYSQSRADQNVPKKIVSSNNSNAIQEALEPKLNCICFCFGSRMDRMVPTTR